MRNTAFWLAAAMSCLPGLSQAATVVPLEVLQFIDGNPPNPYGPAVITASYASVTESDPRTPVAVSINMTVDAAVLVEAYSFVTGQSQVIANPVTVIGFDAPGTEHDPINLYFTPNWGSALLPSGLANSTRTFSVIYTEQAALFDDTRTQVWSYNSSAYYSYYPLITAFVSGSATFYYEGDGFEYDGPGFELAPIPLPAAAPLLVAGLGAMGGLRALNRRRKRG